MTDLSRKSMDAVELFGNLGQPATLTLGVDVWKLADVLALANSRELQPQVFQSLNQAFLLRCEQLKRAAIARALPSEERCGEIWFKPHDFLVWYDTKSGWKDVYLPKAMHAMLMAWRQNSKRVKENTENKELCAASPASADSDSDAEAGKGKTGLSSLGELKDKKGIPEAWAHMCSELRKPLDKRQFGTMSKLRAHCEDKLGVSYRDCLELARIAKKEPGSIPYPEGRRRNSRAS